MTIKFKSAGEFVSEFVAPMREALDQAAKEEAAKPKFDKKAYQREYMRKRRAIPK